MSVITWLKSCVYKSTHFEPSHEITNKTLKGALQHSNYAGSFREDDFVTGYNKWNKQLIVAHRSETWTNAHYGFHVITKDMLQHVQYKHHHKTESVPDSFLNAWIEYLKTEE